MSESIAAAHILEAGVDDPGVSQGGESCSGAGETLVRLVEALGKPLVNWRVAVLGAIGRWPLASEVFEGERNEYLIGGEAFDWKFLAQRLYSDRRVESLIPAFEWQAWIASSSPFAGLVEDEFRRLLGVDKYRAHLSYFYGVTVEQGLLTAVGEEIAKRRTGGGRSADQETRETAFVSLYGWTQERLWREYKASVSTEAAGLAENLSGQLSLHTMDSFTYWLFKRRLKRADPARVASDTRKGLMQLERMRRAEERRDGMLRELME